MRLYDFVLVLRPSLSETDRKKLLTTIKEWLDGVKVVKDEEWGQKPLSYPIKKEIAGFYHLMKLETEKTVPDDFERRVLQNDNVIRHLLLRTK